MTKKKSIKTKKTSSSTSSTCPACAEREMFWKDMRDGARAVMPMLLAFVPALISAFIKEQTATETALNEFLDSFEDKKQFETVMKQMTPNQIARLMTLISMAQQTRTQTKTQT